MEERLNRRSRPRPYDLRRKVLLKNFFREQMSYVPTSRGASSSLSDSSSDTSFIEESSSSIDESETTQSESDENDSSEVLKENIVPSSNENLEPSVLNNDSSSESTPPFKTDNVSKSILSNFSRLSNFMKLRSMSRMTKSNKGVLKAKHICKNKRSRKLSCRTNRFDMLFNKKNCKKDESSESSALNASSKSIFSIFKSHRRKDRKTSDAINNNVACSSTSNQSVQTDISLFVDGINNVEETNRMLVEENMLLSQSLSILMSSTSQTSNNNQDSSVYPPSYQNEIEVFPSYEHNLSFKPNEASTSRMMQENTAVPKSYSRVLRSKSVYEQSGKKTNKCYRTKSLNYRRSSEQRISPSDSVFNLQAMSPPDVDYRKLRFPRVRSPVLQTLPVNSPRRTLRRRPSLPERTYSENIRTVPRRSESMHSYDRKRKSIPFHALPAQAFY